MIDFDVTDIGMRVLLYIDPRSDPVAVALGASTVQVQGRIKGFADDYLTLSRDGFVSSVTGPLPKKDIRVWYKNILDVKYLAE
jgi:hypothetical protein